MAGDQIIDFEAIFDQAKPLFQRQSLASVGCHPVLRVACWPLPIAIEPATSGKPSAIVVPIGQSGVGMISTLQQPDAAAPRAAASKMRLRTLRPAVPGLKGSTRSLDAPPKEIAGRRPVEGQPR
jgi:hypothetical protein